MQEKNSILTMHSQWWPLNCMLSQRRAPERQCEYPSASLSHCSWMVKKAKIKSRLFRKGRGYKTEKSLYHNISVVQTYFEYCLQFSLQQKMTYFIRKTYRKSWQRWFVFADGYHVGKKSIVKLWNLGKWWPCQISHRGL